MTENDFNTNQNNELEISDAELDALANFPPAIDDETMQKLESAASSIERSQQRRLMLLAMARSADDLSEMSLKDPGMFNEMLELVEVYLDHTKALVDFAEKAVLRMKIADARGV